MNKVIFDPNTGEVLKVIPIARSSYEAACFSQKKHIYPNGTTERNPGKTQKDKRRNTVPKTT